MNAFHIGMRELHDEEEDARQDKEETISEKKDRGNTQDKHAQSQAVQLPETYESRVHKRLQGSIKKIILPQSQKNRKNHIYNKTL